MAATTTSLRTAPTWFPSLQTDHAVINYSTIKWGDSKLAAPHYTRALYLQEPKEQSAPIVSRSPCIPDILAHHLMRHKRDSALATKWLPGTRITNMEGALHTLVTALLKIHLAGDYIYRHGHGVLPFEPAAPGALATRQVVLSTAIHPDFEDHQVMFALCKLESDPVMGRDLPATFTVPTIGQKDVNEIRQQYDRTLKEHLVYHLVRLQRLPSAGEPCLTVSAAIVRLRSEIRDGSLQDDSLAAQSVRVGEAQLSLELLANIYVAALVNELSALECLCPNGYAYTYDPPSIFAQTLDVRLMNLLFVRAFLLIATRNPVPGLRLVALNDYVLDPEDHLVPVFQSCLSKIRPHIQVVTRATLFSAPGHGHATGHLDTALLGPGTALVIHNCSDAFGQNIETEGASGSMDGAIGVYSSAAAGLKRDRVDLLDYVF